MVLLQKQPFLEGFFLGNFSQENAFYDILQQKNAFPGYKNKKFKTSENWHFSKGVNLWFCSKNSHLWKVFFLGNLTQENVFQDILEQKNAFRGYKKRSSKSRKIAIFPKGLTHAFGQKITIFPTFFLQAILARKMSLKIFQNE